MGGSFKNALPLLALGGLGVATGGFGLLGGASGAGGAAQMAGVMGATPASGAMAAPSAFGKMFSWASTHKDMIGLGMSGAGLLTQGLGARQAAAMRENELMVQRSQSSLANAEQERDQQMRLRASLATQNNLFAATGVNPSEGSALAAQQAAQHHANRQLSLLGQQDHLQSGLYRSRINQTRKKGAWAMPGALLNFGTVVADHEWSD
ncbi:MAG: hypothetical protein AAF442_00025 [Pseudomonadota bacterium]